jgi:ADP-ribosylglycohydrolase
LTVQHQRLACRKFITNTAALAHELWEGRPLPQYDKLRDKPIRNTGYVADTYASAWHSVLSTDSFEDAIADAINRGGDADTVGAVTGMIAGRTRETTKCSASQLRKSPELVVSCRALLATVNSYSH